MPSTHDPIVIVVGATGQHARVVYEAACLSGISVAGFIAMVDGQIPDVFDAAFLGAQRILDDPGFVTRYGFVVAVGDNETRIRMSDGILSRGGRLRSLVHPSAMISPSAQLGEGSTVLAGAIVASRAVLGHSCIVNHGASVGHDSVLGDAVNVCSGARLAGSTVVGDGAYIGLNASIVQGVRLGARAIIGAGAVVLRNVPDDHTAVGVPARNRLNQEAGSRQGAPRKA